MKDESAGPWTTPKVQIKTRDASLETEERVTGFLSRQKALANVDLCFKIKVRYLAVAEIQFGVDFDPAAASFVWRIELVPADKYQWLDEIVWAEWQKPTPTLPPGAKHLPKEGAVVLVSRCFGPDLTFKAASEDIDGVFRFLLRIESVLASEFAKQLVEEIAPGTT